jgi:transposase
VQTSRAAPPSRHAPTWPASSTPHFDLISDVRRWIRAREQRNVIERFFKRIKNWGGIASRHDKLAVDCRGSSCSPRSWTGCDDYRDTA